MTSTTSTAPMKVLITGTEGYLGSIVGPTLLRAGMQLSAVDTGYYRSGWLYHGTDLTAPTQFKDIRHITAEDLQGVDAVVHMAELSNDPLGQLLPNITYDINHHGSMRLARMAKEAGVRRFVYMSSCSVYGVATAGDVTEDSAVNPQTAYADCKVLVERDLHQLADETFSPTYLRNATAFGASPRMRFDIVLNNLAGLAWTTGEIRMTSDGTPWRPLVHANDIARAIQCVLQAPLDAVHDQVFNVGDTAQNYRVREIAEIIAAAFPGCRLSFGENGGDNRSYRVDFTKINTRLPGFRCEWNAERGAAQLAALFARIDLSRAEFEGRGYTRLKQLEYLLASGQIDQDFYWTDPFAPGGTARPAQVREETLA